MKNGSECRGDNSNSKRRRISISSLGRDVLLQIFGYLDIVDIARASAVCKSWYHVIQSTCLWRDVYYRKKNDQFNHAYEGFLPEPPKDWVRQLVSEHHKSALIHGTVQVCCWKGHSSGVDRCRMRMGSILTGVGDQTVRIWSSRNFQCLEEYSSPNKAPLVDIDFDESKVVGLVGADICIWKRHGNRHLLGGHVQRTYSMCYVDPEVAIGCGDGTIRIFDMYGGQCSRIFRQHSGAVTCLSIAGEQFLISGSSRGSLSVADFNSGQTIASLRQSTASTGISCLCVNQGSYQVFSGTTSGHVYSWDLRTHMPLWETRISPNVIYSIQSLAIDSSTLVLGGIDGVLRIIDAKSGEIFSSYVPNAKIRNISDGLIAKFTASNVTYPLDEVPKSRRPPITCVAVGLNNVVTTHNDKKIMLWTFQRPNDR